MKSPFFVLGLVLGIAMATWAHVPLIRPLSMGCTGSTMHTCGALQ